MPKTFCLKHYKISFTSLRLFVFVLLGVDCSNRTAGVTSFGITRKGNFTVASFNIQNRAASATQYSRTDEDNITKRSPPLSQTHSVSTTPSFLPMTLTFHYFLHSYGFISSPSPLPSCSLPSVLTVADLIKNETHLSNPFFAILSRETMITLRTFCTIMMGTVPPLTDTWITTLL